MSELIPHPDDCVDDFDQPLLKTEDVAPMLRQSESWVRKMVREGEIAAVHSGRHYRFHPAQIAEYLARKRAEGQALAEARRAATAAARAALDPEPEDTTPPAADAPGPAELDPDFGSLLEFATPRSRAALIARQVRAAP